MQWSDKSAEENNASLKKRCEGQGEKMAII